MTGAPVPVNEACIDYEDAKNPNMSAPSRTPVGTDPVGLTKAVNNIAGTLNPEP